MPHRPPPRPPPATHPGRTAVALACALAAAPPGAAAFKTRAATGEIDFVRGVVTARGIAPRAKPGRPDRARAAARTHLKALLFPHPVDGEGTLGDLVSYHPDLAAALELPLQQAVVRRREAIPPDLEEVWLELPLRDLVVALAPFVGERRAEEARPVGDPPPAPPAVFFRLDSAEGPPHTPPLLPSIRGLGGVHAIPATTGLLRRMYRGPVISYGPREPGPGDWVIDVVATGGIGGATLYLPDSAAERLRRLMGTEDPPALWVLPPPEVAAAPGAVPPPKRGTRALGRARKGFDEALAALREKLPTRDREPTEVLSTRRDDPPTRDREPAEAPAARLDELPNRDREPAEAPASRLTALVERWEAERARTVSAGPAPASPPPEPVVPPAPSRPRPRPLALFAAPETPAEAIARAERARLPPRTQAGIRPAETRGTARVRRAAEGTLLAPDAAAAPPALEAPDAAPRRADSGPAMRNLAARVAARMAAIRARTARPAGAGRVADAVIAGDTRVRTRVTRRPSPAPLDGRMPADVLADLPSGGDTDGRLYGATPPSPPLQGDPQDPRPAATKPTRPVLWEAFETPAPDGDVLWQSFE